MAYFWERDVNPPHFPALMGNLKTDVLIIGGGMAGLLCARALTDAGIDCVVAEARTIGNGVTRGTTAVLTAQHDTLYTDLICKFGRDAAKLYLDANLRAVERYRDLAKTIPCAFEDKPSIMYSRIRSDELQSEARAVCSLGFPAEFTTEVPLPFAVAGAVRYPGMAQFHPLQFLYGIAQGLTIYENTFVAQLEGTCAHTALGCINARRVVVATHFPMLNAHGMYFMKLYQNRSFVLAVENLPPLACTLVDMAENGMYFRSYGGVTLIGGGEHRTGKKGGGFDAVEAFVHQYFPAAREVCRWAAQDCMSLDGVPYVGHYSAALPDVYVASGFNEWGMTSSMLASELLRDLILERPNPYAPVFAPDRSPLHVQLFKNMGETFIDFCIPTAKRCPHLGCSLRWNSAEHSWDCPCHGSRFDEKGALLDNPAMKRAKVGK